MPSPPLRGLSPCEVASRPLALPLSAEPAPVVESPNHALYVRNFIMIMSGVHAFKL